MNQIKILPGGSKGRGIATVMMLSTPPSRKVFSDIVDFPDGARILRDVIALRRSIEGGLEDETDRFRR